MSERRSITIRAVVEWHDHHCGDDLALLAILIFLTGEFKMFLFLYYHATIQILWLIVSRTEPTEYSFSGS